MQLSSFKARFLSISALIISIGILMSGPIGNLIVQLVHKQEAWNGVEEFISSYSRVMSMPIAFGFLLVIGFILFFASLYKTGNEDKRIFEIAGIMFCAIFGAIISLNYIINVGYVPNVLDQSGANIAFLTMSNPKSLAWVLEMFGYGFLGLATGIVAPLFAKRGIQGVIRYLLILNAIISILGAVVTAVNLSGVLSIYGMIGYYFWNLLILIIMILVIIEFRFGLKR
jgi:hypothetical protein